MTIPPQDDPVGLTIRLLISENLTPGSSSYDADQVLSGMQEMWSTIVNRLSRPRDFCAAGATDAIGIITAVCGGGGRQFAGFSLVNGSVVIDPPQLSRINTCLQKADGGNPNYVTFVNNAVTTASQDAVSQWTDMTEIDGVPVLPGPFGWRTAGHGGPGGRMIAIPESMGGVISGNQFFALKS